MQNGKTPGPDSYSVEFYKTFPPKLAPLLLKMFENSLHNTELPQSLTEAFLTLILKPGKDPATQISYKYCGVFYRCGQEVTQWASDNTHIDWRMGTFLAERATC